MEQTVKDRTRKGIFARSGSTHPRARYYNEEYAERKGKSLTPVTMEDTGAMLQDLTWRPNPIPPGTHTITIKHHFASARSRKIAEYHYPMGAGKNQIRRRFIYVTGGEADRIMKRMLRELQGDGVRIAGIG